jgi:uncharacterized membrane protein
MMKWMKALLLPLVVAVGSATAYTGIILSSPRSKDSYIGNAVYLIGFIVVYALLLLPTLVGCSVWAWPELKTKQAKSLLLGFDLAILVLTLIVPDQVIRNRW